jgi:CRP/FNR family transcriptional regulator, cyclic AMP receptor protein
MSADIATVQHAPTSRKVTVPPPTKAQLLKGVDLFSPLDEHQIGLLAPMALEKTYSRGEAILFEDDDSHQGFFLLIEGEVKVVLTSMDGKETILASLKEGDFFGEMALLDGEPRSATVRAVDASRLLSIRRDDFLQFLRRYPDVALVLLAELSRRLRKSNKQVSSLAMMGVHGRVADALTKLMDERGKRQRTREGKAIVVIHDRPTQQFIADMSGAARETVSRVLKHFEQKGWIAIDGRDLVIIEPGKLQS